MHSSNMVRRFVALFPDADKEKPGCSCERSGRIRQNRRGNRIVGRGRLCGFIAAPGSGTACIVL